MQHIVLSHHGLLEHGAAKLPSTPEAIFVSQLDNLDAHTQTALDSARPWVKTAVGDEAFTERMWSLNTKLYRRDPLKNALNNYLLNSLYNQLGTFSFEIQRN